TPQTRPFPCVDRFERMPEGERASRLHLDDDEHVAAGGHDVDLALRTAPVAVQDPIASRDQVPCRPELARPAENVFRCHPESIADPAGTRDMGFRIRAEPIRCTLCAGTTPASSGRPQDRLARSLAVERQLLRDLELPPGELLDVDVLEREHAHGLHETVGAIDVPHPDVAHRHLEVEVVLGVATDDVDVVGEIEAPLRLDHVLELRHDVPVLPVESELELAVVVVESLVVHGPSILEARGVPDAHLGARTRGTVLRSVSEQSGSVGDRPRGAMQRAQPEFTDRRPV
ncbi:hypothetical protein ABE10_11470, partial [Bacillus toyonensis]|nr:hypothetical protein [Bacillus toyonensis]